VTRDAGPAAVPDIELTTSVTADRLRFGDDPETEVRFHGSRGRETYSGADRTNLPEPVEPGTDYHDVRVDYRLATALRPGQVPAPEPDSGPERNSGPEPDSGPEAEPDDGGRRAEVRGRARGRGPARRRPQQ
jgi:hypothetical protein